MQTNPEFLKRYRQQKNRELAEWIVSKSGKAIRWIFIGFLLHIGWSVW